MSKTIDLERVRRGKTELSRAVELGKQRGERPARPVPVAQITAPATLTVEELALSTRLAEITIRRDIKAGRLKAANGGGKSAYRISRTEAEAWWRGRGGGALWNEATPADNTPEARAKAILQALRSGDKARRNAAIIQLAKSDEATVELVEDAIEEAEAAYDGPQDDLSDWRALDGEPFHFPEEPADYLTGLYKDKGEER